MAMGNKTSTTAVRETRASRLAPILPAIGVTIAAFLWLNHVNPAFRVTEDGIRDQLLARDCTDLNQCHLIGAGTSLNQFHQGAVWLDLLIAVRLLGGDTATARTVVLALLALAVGTLCVVVYRWLDRSIALPASVLLIATLGISLEPSQLVNGSVSAFPDILTAVALLCYGLSGAYRFLVVAAFALGIGSNVHVASLSLIPSLLAIAVLARPRPWQAVLVSIAALVVPYFFTSRAALLANLLGLVRQGWLVPVVIGSLIVVLVSASLGSRFRRLSWTARAWVIGCILMLPCAGAAVWLALWQHHPFGIRYLYPILGPTVVLVAALVSLPFEIGARRVAALRWTPTAASLAAVMFVALHVYRGVSVTGSSEPWTLDEAGAISAEATRRGWSYEDLVFRLQARGCAELLAGVSVWAPPPGQAMRDDGSQLQVIKVGREALPELADPHAVLLLKGNTVAVVREIASWLQPQALRACRRPISSELSPSCSSAARPIRETRNPEQFLFVSRSNPGIHSLDLSAPYIATYEIPLMPAAGESRDLTVIDDVNPECAWRITRAEGVRVEGDLPSRRVRLHSGSGVPGSVVIEKPFATTGCPAYDFDNRYPPCVLETRPGDPLGALAEVG